MKWARRVMVVRRMDKRKKYSYKKGIEVKSMNPLKKVTLLGHLIEMGKEGVYEYTGGPTLEKIEKKFQDKHGKAQL